MTKINTGGPAFPATETHEYFGNLGHMGMTLRFYAALKALPQAVEDYGQPSPGGESGQRYNRGNPVLPYSNGFDDREKIIARQAFRYADAMIAASDEVQP